MTFTDDDLNRLKEFADTYRPDGVAVRCEVLQALLARLEAAESVLSELTSLGIGLHPRLDKSIEAWRKAAGKDKP